MSPVIEYSVDQKSSMIAECRRQSESCLYTSTMLFEWLKWIRWSRLALAATPIIFGAIVGLSILKGWVPDAVAAAMTLVVSVFPAMESILKVETRLEDVAKLAAEFKNLQDRFRQLAELKVPYEFDAGKVEFSELMGRFEKARSEGLTPPKWAYEKARSQIKRGDYAFDVDTKDTAS
jgi:hypothetical protein